MRQSFVFLIALFVLATDFFSFPSYSQDQAPAPVITSAVPTTPSAEIAPATNAAPVITTQNPSEVEPFKPVPVAEKPGHSATGEMARQLDKYVDPTYENLARLYWGLGILDVNKDLLIDNYVAITECEMYQSYVNNDLEWREIREATKKHLRESYRKFPTTFKIMIPLYLGSYNYEDEFFEVNQKESAIEFVRNIETVYYSKTTTCGLLGDLEGYPRNLILYLNRPFSLPKLPIEKELARLYLDDMNEQLVQKRGGGAVNTNAVAKAGIKDRVAFLELMFRVHSFKETKTTVGGMLKAVVYAQVEYIRVYADYDKEKLLYEKDMFAEERRKRKKRESDHTEEDMALPDGPIFEDATKKDKKK